MKKLALLLILLCLSACQENIKQDDPVVQTSTISNKQYNLEDGWIVQEFEFEDEVVSYQLKDNLILNFVGTKKQE